jgi:biotin carboxyl carrier protein
VTATSRPARQVLVRLAGSTSPRLPPLVVEEPASRLTPGRRDRRTPDSLAGPGGQLTVHDGVRASLAGRKRRRSSVLVLPASGLAPVGVRAFEIVLDGWRFEVAVEDGRQAALRERASRGVAVDPGGRRTEVRAIIPGRVVTVEVEVGRSVAEGQRILVIEAMKMQNELRAPRAGEVTRVMVVAGRAVEAGDLLVVIE